MIECDRTDHTKEAKYNPILLLWPPLKNYDQGPTEIFIGMECCETCKNTVRPEDFINDEIWQKIVAFHVYNKKLPPERSTAGITWKPLEKA